METKRLTLSPADFNVLKAFFNELTDSPSLLNANWRSAREHNRNLEDRWTRTQDRLEKLAGLDLVKKWIINYRGRLDRYWRINLIGIYCVFITLETKNEILNFIRANKDIMPELSLFEKIDLENDIRFNFFKRQVEEMIKTHNYYSIEGFVKKWFATNFGCGTVGMMIPWGSISQIVERYKHDKEEYERLLEKYGLKQLAK